MQTIVTRPCGHVGNLFHLSPCRTCNVAWRAHGANTMEQVIAQVFGEGLFWFL